MTPLHITLACLAALLLAAGYKILESRRFKALNWPPDQGYYGFRRRVMRYLRQSGWTIDKRTTLQVDFFALRRTHKYAVICLPSHMDVTGSRVRDLASLPSTSTKSRPVVCVTLDQVPAQLVKDAAMNNIRVIWYKDLASF
jgi:hypothetical protein